VTTHAFWAYLGVVALITVTPWPDTAVVLRNAVRYGPTAGIAMLLAASAWRSPR
jgi:threonine/homoserine/homoserine lactone efflux protein